MNRLMKNEKICQQELSPEIVELSDEDLEKVVGGCGNDRDHNCSGDYGDWSRRGDCGDYGDWSRRGYGDWGRRRGYGDGLLESALGFLL